MEFSENQSSDGLHFGVLRLIHRFTRAYGMALFVFNPCKDRFEEMYSVGYPDSLLKYLRTEFVEQDDTIRQIRSGPSAPYCWEDFPAFRASSAVEKWFLPHGITEGSSMFLQGPDGQLRGVLHMSLTDDVFPPAVRRLLEASRPELQEIVTPRRNDNAVHLTRRECEVLKLIAAGKKNISIAKDLRISPSTVQTHIENLLRKLESASRTEAVVRAHQLNLLNLGG